MQNYSFPETHRRLAVENLKRCPLCGTVNARLNHECFVCRWRGEFDRDPHSVEEGLLEILEDCPELIDCIINLPRPSEGLLEKAVLWLRARLRRGVDLAAQPFTAWARVKRCSPR